MDMNPVVSWMVMVSFWFCWPYSGYSQVCEEDLSCGVSWSDSREGRQYFVGGSRRWYLHGTVEFGHVLANSFDLFAKGM